MNSTRRKAIEALLDRARVALTQLENLPDVDDIKTEAKALRDEEQEYYDNMPEGLQAGEKGEAANEAAEQLGIAHDKLEEIADAITTLRDNMQEAIDALESAKG